MEKNHTQLWNECLKVFRDNIPSEQYDAWFKDITSLSYENGSLTINVPSPFFVEQLEERYIKILGKALHRVYGANVKLYYHYNQVGNEPTTGVKVGSSNPSPAVVARPANMANPFKICYYGHYIR